MLANAIVEVSAPALREGHILLERVSKNDPGARGVVSLVSAIHCLSCKAMNKSLVER